MGTSGDQPNPVLALTDSLPTGKIPKWPLTPDTHPRHPLNTSRIAKLFFVITKEMNSAAVIQTMEGDIAYDNNSFSRIRQSDNNHAVGRDCMAEKRC